MLSCRCDISVSFCHGSRFAPLPARCGRRAGGCGRLRVLESDASGIVEEELRKRVDKLERDYESNIRGGCAPEELRDCVSEGTERPVEVGAETSTASAASRNSFLEGFELPVDFRQPMLYSAVALTALGLWQSIQGSPNLDGFSLDSLVHFQIPIQMVLFASVFLVSVAGWGFSLAAITGVSLLGPDVTVTEAQALVALMAVPVNAFMVCPHLKSKKFDKQVVDKLVVGAMVATPLGVSALNFIDESSALVGLGTTILAYCSYATFNILQTHHKAKEAKTRESPTLTGSDCDNDGGLTGREGGQHTQHPVLSRAAVGSPEEQLTVHRMADPKEVILSRLANSGEYAVHSVTVDDVGGVDQLKGSCGTAALGSATTGDAELKMPGCDHPMKYPVLGTWGAGLVAGLAGGAFDVPGPPLVMFADLTGMASDAEQTKANLLPFFALNAQMVAISDLADGRFDVPFIWPTVVLAIPTMLLANAAGGWCSKFMDQEKFRYSVVGLLAVCGLHFVGAF